jgi:flagellar hook-associated protein 1 FlgK
MSNLLATFLTSANALSAYDRVLQVTQNNVANASTAGFAKQRQSLHAMRFDLQVGSSGGVTAGEVQSLRDEYSERAVWRENESLGFAQQQVNSISALEPVFDISGKAGIPNALNQLFASFSAWGQLPNDGVSKQAVLDRAADLANAFNRTASSLTDIEQDTDRQLRGTVKQVNDLVAHLRYCNVKLMQGDRNDSGLDAEVHATLEQLSAYADISAVQQADGSYQVTLHGESLLLSSDRQYPLSATSAPAGSPAYSGGTSNACILAADGTDVTSKLETGSLGALLDFRNRVLPSYIGSDSQIGDLNTMAQQFADRVNQLLSGGLVSDGPPPQPGEALFTYDSANPTNIAHTLSVRAGLQPGELGAIDPGPPETGNGIPLKLAAMAESRDSADRINGSTFVEYYGEMAARAGSLKEDAQSRMAVQQSALTQAKELRQQMSGVSLDEEAAILIQFQRAYEANSRLITILNQLTEDLIQILRP